MPDPIASDFSPYSYSYNNPTQFVDPNGEFPWLAIAIGMYIGGALHNKHINPTYWNWNDPMTYVSIAAGGFSGGYLAGIAYPTTGIDIYLQEIKLFTLKAQQAAYASSLAYSSYNALRAGYRGYMGLGLGAGVSSGSLNPNVSLEMGAFTGHYEYEGVQISLYDYVDSENNYFQYHLLPDGSYFRDRRSGRILWENAEYWVYKAGGSDVPWWGDPVNWIAYSITPIRHSFKIDFFKKPEPFYMGIKTPYLRRNILHLGYRKAVPGEGGWHFGVGSKWNPVEGSWEMWKHIYFYPKYRIWP